MPTLYARKAIEYARLNGAKIINLSFITTGTLSLLESEISNAWDAGLLIVAAAGIHGSGYTNQKSFISDSPKVIAVVGTGQNDVKQVGSPWGSWVDVAAPGDDIWTTVPGNSYAESAGDTPSLATSHVSGLAALIWSAYPTLTNAGVKHQIETTADSVALYSANPSLISQLGRGRINAYRALTEWSGPLQVASGKTLVWKDYISPLVNAGSGGTGTDIGRYGGTDQVAG